MRRAREKAAANGMNALVLLWPPFVGEASAADLRMLKKKNTPQESAVKVTESNSGGDSGERDGILS